MEIPAGTHRCNMLPGNWRYLQGLTDMICCLATGDPCRDSQIKYATWQLEIPAGTHRYNMLPGNWRYLQGHRYNMLPGNRRSLQGLTDTLCCLATGDTCSDTQMQYAAWQLEIPAGTHIYDMLPGNWRSLQGLTDRICYLATGDTCRDS